MNVTPEWKVPATPLHSPLSHLPSSVPPTDCKLVTSLCLGNRHRDNGKGGRALHSPGDDHISYKSGKKAPNVNTVVKSERGETTMLPEFRD